MFTAVREVVREVLSLMFRLPEGVRCDLRTRLGSLSLVFARLWSLFSTHSGPFAVIHRQINPSYIALDCFRLLTLAFLVSLFGLVAYMTLSNIPVECWAGRACSKLDSVRA